MNNSLVDMILYVFKNIEWVSMDQYICLLDGIECKRTKRKLLHKRFCFVNEKSDRKLCKMQMLRCLLD